MQGVTTRRRLTRTQRKKTRSLCLQGIHPRPWAPLPLGGVLISNKVIDRATVPTFAPGGRVPVPVAPRFFTAHTEPREGGTP